MTATRDADSRKTGRKQATRPAALNAPVNAPWPDHQARQEMSEAERACEDGKHDKNADWKKNW